MAGSWSNVFCMVFGAMVALAAALFGAILARSLEPRQLVDKLTNPMRAFKTEKEIVNVPPMSGDEFI